MPPLPTGTVTLFFTDIEGSTRLLQQLGDRYQSVIADHHRLLREVIEVSGHVVEDRGDGLFAVFSRAVDALTAAADVQRALAAHPWPEGAGVRVRIGLHTGDPALAGANYVGLDVHRAARLCEAGHGGQVLLSAATRELVERQLPECVTLRDLGEHRLRDLQRPERIAQAVITGLLGDFPALRTIGRRPNNLPVARDPLIGRDADVATASELLLRSDVGLVTLTGPGGSGKTRLGLQVAATLLDRFEDGVFLVMLAPISDPALVPGTIARALGLRETAERPILETLKAYLRGNEVLVLLDNFEQILPAASVVAELLGACPRLKVLATSRAALRIRGERELSVPPLALPEAGADATAEGLQQYAAVALFAARAREVRPDFEITTENAPAVAEICQRLDGLPLAIELAAARIRLLTAQAMLGRLGRRLPFLTGGSRDLPTRQQTLRNTIVWSYDLLDADEQRLFRALGVFVGGWSLEAAEAVCNPTGELDVLGSLESLAAKSLVRQVDSVQAEPRFTMLETIREYALERLEASGEVDEARLRHAEHYARLAEKNEDDTRTDTGGAALDLLETEHDNIRAALVWVDASDEVRNLLPRLANPLWFFWWQRGHWAEGRRWYNRILELDVEPAGRLGALRGLGQLALQAGELSLAATCWDEAAHLARQLGDLPTLSLALGRGARVAADGGALAEAQALADEGLAVARRAGDQQRIAMAWNELGSVARAGGDLGGARQAWEEALSLSRQYGLGFYVPYGLQNLSAIASDQGDLDRAVVFAEQALPLFRQRNDIWGIAGTMSRLIRAARLHGDRNRAAALAHENLTLVYRIGSQSAVATNLDYLAWVAQANEQSARAARLRGAIAQIREATGLRLSSTAQRELDGDVALLRTTLGDAAFTAAWDEGHALSTDRAVRYALQEIELD